MAINEMTVTSINERAAEEFYRRGQEQEKEGNHEKAAEFYERALGENPDHEMAAFRLAVLYDRRAVNFRKELMTLPGPGPDAGAGGGCGPAGPGLQSPESPAPA